MSPKKSALLSFTLFLIVGLALVLRLWGISKLPVGFTQDEASFGYDAYSLLLTGKDQWGERLPLSLRSFGDFKLPLYAYLTIPSIYFFGLTEFATRLPNALLGGLAIGVTYLMVGEMTKNKKLALLSALFLAVSPWHISLSRGAFEANLTTFFIPLGIWLFLRGLTNKGLMLLAVLTFGLNLFSYHSARLITPVVSVLLISYFYQGSTNLIQKCLDFFKNYKIASLVLILFFSFAFGTMFFGGGKRGIDILITNPTDRWEGVSIRRYEAVLLGLADSYSRIFSNKITYSVDLFVSNYLSYLSPTFLFTQGAGEWTYGMIPGRGVLYLFELVFVIVGLFAWSRGSKFVGIGFIITWILVSVMPAALTKGPGFAANRAAVMMPAIQILSAYGSLVLFDSLAKISKTKHFRLIYFGGLVVVLILCTVGFFEDYVYHASVRAEESMHYGVKDVIKYTEVVKDDFGEIRVSRSLSVPQIWVAFYQKWDPEDYQLHSKNWLEYETKGFLYVDQFEDYRLGKYSFGSIDVNTSKHRDGLLLVGKASEFPSDVKSLFSTKYFNLTPAYVVVDSASL